MKVPFLDLKPAFRELEQELDMAYRRVFTLALHGLYTDSSLL